MMMELRDYSWPCTHDHSYGPLKIIQGVDGNKSLEDHRQGKFSAPSIVSPFLGKHLYTHFQMQFLAYPS